MERKKILLTGPAPQNIGGVSMHLRRLEAMMAPYADFDIIDEGKVRHEGVFNLRSGNLFRYFSKINRSDIVHIHSGVPILRFGHIIAAKYIFRKPVFVTLHCNWKALGKWEKATIFFLRLADKVIAVNSESYNALAAGRNKSGLMLKEAFLPPDMEAEPELPAEITDFIDRKKDDGFRIAVSNAWRLVEHAGQDLYGLDMCIDAAASLRDNGLKYVFIFVVPDAVGSRQRLDEANERLRQLNLTDRVILVERNLSFVRLAEAADIVVRPTNTDGDALTVREALWLGKPVVASDVVARPEGTILFKTRDSNDFIRAIRSTETYPSHETKVSSRNLDYLTFYKEIYNID